jgi:Stage II sporulation protein E (SpoIIE)
MVSTPQPTTPKGSREPRVPGRRAPERPGAGRRRALRALRRRALRALRSVRSQLTKQFITRNRRLAFVLSLVTIAIAVAAVHVSEWWFSPGVIILPILAGGLLLWPRALRIYFVFAAAALIYVVMDRKAGAGIVATIVLTAIFADAAARTREKLGVQGLRGDRMLLELRDRIRAQGKLPELGEGWGSSLVLKPAGGSSFGGDFVVSFCDGKMLEVALVDVSGKGIDAGTRALLLSGAFGGLLGSVPRDDFLPACNAYMRRGPTAEGFVTAVHASLDLTSGEYMISSAGHPPAVHYDASAGRWRLTRAHGIVLGVVPDLRGAATETEHGVLQRGDALMLYTDGLVESPGRDIDAGTDRLLGEAERMLSSGFSAGAPALVAAMQREIGGSDDCALVLIWRT